MKNFVHYPRIVLIHTLVLSAAERTYWYRMGRPSRRKTIVCLSSRRAAFEYQRSCPMSSPENLICQHHSPYCNLCIFVSRWVITRGIPWKSQTTIPWSDMPSITLAWTPSSATDSETKHKSSSELHCAVTRAASLSTCRRLGQKAMSIRAYQWAQFAKDDMPFSSVWSRLK